MSVAITRSEGGGGLGVRFWIVLCLLLTRLLVGPVHAAPNPCADAFGYTCADEPSSYMPVQSSPASVSSVSPLRDWTKYFLLPFNFKFYGYPYSLMSVTSDGMMTFSNDYTVAADYSDNSSLASYTNHRASILPFWDAMWATISYPISEARGTAPDQQFVTEWRAQKFTAAGDSRSVSFQVILQENGEIIFQYSGIDPNVPTEQGSSATVGLVGPSPYFLEYAYNQPVLSDGTAIRFKPPGPDIDAPIITITSPANGASFKLNESVLANYGCSDLRSGVAQCAGTVLNGAPIDTATVGAKSFRVDAKDNLNNTGNLISSYQVTYNFGGFLPPVDISTGQQRIMNQTKAGSSVPVKFSLTGNQGMSIFAAGYPASKPVNCAETTSIDPLEEIAAAGSSGLWYDPTTDQYRYVWKTDKAWATTCRVLTLRFMDGTGYNAYFNFTR